MYEREDLLDRTDYSFDVSKDTLGTKGKMDFTIQLSFLALMLLGKTKSKQIIDILYFAFLILSSEF